ncbi:MAG: TPR end-of-group domain-containing protein [Lacipirellulaceae bacterium]
MGTAGVVSFDVKRRQRCQLECASREAEGYLELGMQGHALRVLQHRGPLVHGDAHACYLLGETLRGLERYREAVYPLRRSATLRPAESGAWLALGWCYKRSGRLELAIEALERALEFAPNEAILHYNLACYHSLARSPLAALRRLKRSLDLDRSLLGLVREESDFEPMRRDPGFRMLLSAYGAR